MLADKKEITIIAEAGVNHNGDINLALQLVDAASNAGADVIKFQLFQADALASPTASKAAYQKQPGKNEESQLDMLRKLELGPKAFQRIAAYCAQKSIGFLVTPFDEPSIRQLQDIGVHQVKIPSGEVTNVPYLRQIGRHNWDIILSTGMCTLEEVQFAVDILEKAGCKRERISILHCTTEYPAPFEEVNLCAMHSLAMAFPGMRIGYSDHTEGIEVSIAAAALGAQIIEKHFTLSREMEGPDHKASLEPDMLAQMVRSIRHVEAALGDGEKRPTASEFNNMSVVRKSIVAARDIKTGEILTTSMLCTKRPGSGLSPIYWDSILDKKAPASLPKDSPLPKNWISISSPKE